jgi:hypothetical protein
MPAIRILLIGVPRMLSDIITNAIAGEPDMVIVAGVTDPAAIGRRADVVIFPAGDARFSDTGITRLLRANPRLGLLAIDGAADSASLHHLVPARDDIGPLAQASLTGAIRAGAALRRT